MRILQRHSNVIGDSRELTKKRGWRRDSDTVGDGPNTPPPVLILEPFAKIVRVRRMRRNDFINKPHYAQKLLDKIATSSLQLGKMAAN
jgi:hypothetical protein